jgi:molybdenum cofactor synthesis domain-containing protein
MMGSEEFNLVHRDIVPDEADLISAKLRQWCDGGEVDLVLSTGGTGLGPRDVTPEATRAVLDIEVPGIAETMRSETLKHTSMAMLSRSVAGVRSGCLVINLPGSPKGVRECLEVAATVIPHALGMIEGRRGHPEH